MGFLSLYLFQATVETLLESMLWLSTNYRAQQSQWDLLVRNSLVRLEKITTALDLIFTNLLAQGSYQFCRQEDEEDKSALSWIWDCQLLNGVWQIYPQTKHERNAKRYEKGHLFVLCLKHKILFSTYFVICSWISATMDTSYLSITSATQIVIELLQNGEP